MTENENKTERPDLSFITSQKFEKNKDYRNWFLDLPDEQKDMVFKFQMIKLPELIQCAEMLYDEHKNKPDSLVFKMVSETLNVK